jgi:hypothetical protein
VKAKKIHMGPAQIALDLGDGSERGEYVNQDYILHRLGRPHRGINLMYCYYPLDEGWPTRASQLPLPQGKTAGYAWDYAYDDYFPYEGGIGGTTEREPFASMRDVRRHGREVAHLKRHRAKHLRRMAEAAQVRLDVLRQPIAAMIRANNKFHGLLPR